MTPKSSQPFLADDGAKADDLGSRRRLEILEGACAVFDDRGYAATRIADISGHLGIGIGTVYRYFTGKDDVMDQLLTQGVARFLEAMREQSGAAGPEREGDGFLEQVTQVAHRLLNLAADEPVLLRVIIDQAPAALPERFGQLTDELAANVAAYLDRGVRDGFLRADLDTPTVADAMVGVALPAMRRAVRGQLDTAARETTARSIGLLIGHGALRTD